MIVIRLASMNLLQMKIEFGLTGWWDKRRDFTGFWTSEDPQAVARCN